MNEVLTTIGPFTIYIALVIFLLLKAAKTVGVDRIPERWRWLRPVILASMAEAGQMLLGGQTTPAEALRYAAMSAILAMGFHGVVKEASPNAAK